MDTLSCVQFGTVSVLHVSRPQTVEEYKRMTQISAVCFTSEKDNSEHLDMCGYKVLRVLENK